MVGRTDELATISQLLSATLGGQGRVLGITAEAGLGKSRLVAEVVRLEHQRGMVGYGGAAQATGTRSPYLVWQPIWRAIFDLDPAAPLRRQLRALEGLVDEWASERSAALPLLGPLLGLAIPENDFTEALEARDRQGALHALLRDGLVGVAREAQSAGGGLLIVLEDVHWIDAASVALLVELAQAISALPVLLVLVYRPLDPAHLSELRLADLPTFSEISLQSLDHAATAQLIQAKLLQLFPARGGAVPAALVTQLLAHTQGNPFYLEELLNYMHDRALDPRDGAALDALSLPDSLHRLILSRLDQLSAAQQVIMKLASVVGRRFLVAWLQGAFPTLAVPEALRAELDALAQLELTPLDTPEPELAYLFKHVITREVAYESLAATTRAALHGQLASYVEQHAATTDALLDVLAYHYELSDNLAKKRAYLRRAGEAAAARYANAAAVAYLSRALELAPPDDLEERYALLLAREQVFGLHGDREPQQADLAELAALAATIGTPVARAEVALHQARYANATGDFASAEQAARAAAALARAAELPRLEATAHQRLGSALYFQRNYAAAQTSLAQSLALAETTGDTQQQCVTLNTLSNVAADMGDYRRACAYLERSAGIARATGNRRMEGYALADLAAMTDEQGQPGAAITYLEPCLAAARALGDRWLESRICGNGGFMRYKLGDYGGARAVSDQSLALATEIGDRQQMAYTYGNLGLIALAQGDHAGARAAFQSSLALAERLDDRLLKGHAQHGLGNVALALGDLTAAEQAFTASVAHAREVGAPALVAEPLAGLAQVALARGATESALALVEEVLTHLATGTLDGTEEPMAVYLACYAALRANADARAPALLARARSELLARADQISDPEARQRFLAQVAAHRAVLAAEGDSR